jgi:hypothetical protein
LFLLIFSSLFFSLELGLHATSLVSSFSSNLSWCSSAMSSSGVLMLDEDVVGSISCCCASTVSFCVAMLAEVGFDGLVSTTVTDLHFCTCFPHHRLQFCSSIF